MSVEHNTATMDTVDVQVQVNLDDLPMECHSIRADVHPSGDRLSHGDIGYVMRVEMSWLEHCRVCNAPEALDTDWIIDFDTIAECAAYFGAICDRYPDLDNASFGFLLDPM